MIFSTLLVALVCSSSSAFRPTFAPRRPLPSLTASPYDEFEYLLRETSNFEQPVFNNRRSSVAVRLGDNDKTLLVSSFPAPTEMMEEQQQQLEDDLLAEELQDEEDIFGGTAKIRQYQEQPTGLGAKLKTMDLPDIVLTLVIPSVALFAAGRWSFNRISDRVLKKVDTTLDSFASEMVYHDGDFEEMRMCVADYNRKLVYLGPLKRDKMIKRYLQAYAKRKTISPQAISSLSYAFSLFNLDEETAANILVTLCIEMGTDKTASSGKLLFLGSRILKSPQGKQALQPIKDMIKGTYREASVAETMVETSQQAMAEAAYKTTVLSAGKTQTQLTPGWEVLGLEKDVAQRIWDEQKKGGFLTERELMYGGQTTKYDKNGNALSKDAKPSDTDKDEEEDESVSGVFECGKCGFTLFIAAGRESKFYGSTFKCPECGAAKSEFTSRDDFGED